MSQGPQEAAHPPAASAPLKGGQQRGQHDHAAAQQRARLQRGRRQQQRRHAGEHHFREHHDRRRACRQPGCAELQRPVAQQQHAREQRRRGDPGGVWRGEGLHHARVQADGAHHERHQHAAAEHREHAGLPRHRMQAPQRDVGEREHEAAQQGEAVGHRQPMQQCLRGRAPGPDHQHHACEGQRQPRDRPGRGALAEHLPGQQHRPGGHQVEEQDHAHHVAHRDRPVEGHVVQARAEGQQPELRMRAYLRPEAGAQRQQRKQHAAVHQRRGPERVQAGRVHLPEGPPCQPPDEGIEQQGEDGQRGGHGKSGPGWRRVPGRGCPAHRRRARPAGAGASVVVVVPRDVQQVFHLVVIAGAIVDVPAPDQPHHARHHEPEDRDRTEHRQPHLERQAVERAQPEDGRLLVEVLHGDGPARAHEVVAAVLQQRVHGHDEVSAQAAQEDQEGNGDPDALDEHHQDQQHAHGDAQRDDLGGHVQPHAHGGHHGPHRGADGDHARERRRLGGVVGQRGGRPGQHDELQVAAGAPEEGGGGQGDLPELVAPEAVVAGPEIGEQRQRVARHGAHFDTGVRNAGVEPGGGEIDGDERGDGRLGRGVHAGVHERDVHRQQPSGDVGAHQLAAQQHAQDDGGDREALDPAVGLDQLRGRQQFGEDAVLGGGVGRGAQAHHGIGDERMGAEQHHEAADDLDRVAHEHDLALGHRVREGAHEGGQHHVEQGEHRHQRGPLPFRGAVGAQQFDGRHEECVVGQRAAELRRHDGVETALHRMAVGCISGTDALLNLGPGCK